MFRNPRYPLGKPYLKEYWKHVPISEPEEDVDSRNTLYMLRNQVLLSVLYPHDPKLREMYVSPTFLWFEFWLTGLCSFVGTMRLLVERVQEEEAAASNPIQGRL